MQFAVAWLIACAADPQVPPTEPAIDLDECLMALGDSPRAEVWYSGASLVVEDGAEIGFAYAPQGGLYTPFFVRLWGMPELYMDLDGGGRAWMHEAVVDPTDGYVLHEDEGSQWVHCVPTDSESYLEFEFHAQYFGEGGSTHSGLRVEDLQQRQVRLTIELGPHPAPAGGATQWGNATFTTDPVPVAVGLEYDVVLMDSVPL